MPLYKCNQKGCEQPGLYKFTWPGKDEAHICILHVDKLKQVAAALQMDLQVRSVLDGAEYAETD